MIAKRFFTHGVGFLSDVVFNAGKIVQKVLTEKKIYDRIALG